MNASSPRRPLIGGNWKCHTVLEEATRLASEVRRRVERYRDVDVVVFPPYPFLAPVARVLDGSRVALGAQDCHDRDRGAFTSAVSAPMIASVGATWVLVGHSERRRVFGDTDEIVAAKLRRALEAGLRPVLCIGETLDEREAGRTHAVLERQLDSALGGLSEEHLGRMALAYEPVWAIGTGRTATPAQAQDAHAFVREWLASRVGSAVAAAMRIQYGGSVKPGNVDELMACPDVDGALVGGASLDAEAFARIVGFRR